MNQPSENEDEITTVPFTITLGGLSGSDGNAKQDGRNTRVAPPGAGSSSSSGTIGEDYGYAETENVNAVRLIAFRRRVQNNGENSATYDAAVNDIQGFVLALVAGLSINGTFAALFSSIVPFSVFPIISLVLTVYCLHQRYLNRTMPVGLPGLAAACFILGVLLYSTVVRAEYPDIGSNFFPAVLSVIMVFWIGAKMRNRKQEVAE